VRYGRLSPPYPTISGFFEIYQEFGVPYYLYAGQAVGKVGASTGWTVGEIQDTCVGLAWFKPNTWLLCQDAADYASSAGDSGAPVFEGTDDVMLIGVHYGIANGPSGTVKTLSSWWNVEGDFGEDMTAH
jgi:hypothetical protein